MGPGTDGTWYLPSRPGTCHVDLLLMGPVTDGTWYLPSGPITDGTWY